jgi:hypothetical protein
LRHNFNGEAYDNRLGVACQTLQWRHSPSIAT